MRAGGAELLAALRGLGRPVALEGESRLPLTGIADHALSWAQWFADTDAPGVLRAHWFERRHMMHHIRRWNRDRSAELQSAWVNGCGVLIWDDVFGVWVGWSERDRATLRAMLRVQRALAGLLQLGEWTPLCDLHPAASAAGVHGHRYELDGVCFWALINRADTDYDGPLFASDRACWDLTAGGVLEPGLGTVRGRVPARSIAGFASAQNKARLPDGSPAFEVLRRLAESAEPIDGSSGFPARPVVPVEGPPAARRAAAPEGTVRLLAGRRQLRVTFRRRETGQGDETPWIGVWKPSPPDLHEVVERLDEVLVGNVAVDRSEVSVAEYAAFLDATGYRPRVRHRFLAGGGGPDEPVTGVDLDDARAFAQWRGGRLPTPGEWQLAMYAGAERRRPLVWNWTDSERTDGVTRYALLKGGSDFAAGGSHWYVDGGERPPEWELKLVLPGGGLQRSNRIGFRCAYDLGEEGLQ
jgi:hypothetical protein